VNVISSSYGNDSVALIQWARETALKDVTVTYCNTGWAAPWWHTNRVQKGEEMAELYSFKTHRCESIGMTALVRQRKGFPGNGMQFCTSELKIFPFLKWLDEVDSQAKAVIVIGKRRAESERRANTPEFIESSEIHGGRKVWHPLYLHTDFERNQLLARAGWEPLPHRSLECSPCVNANRSDFLRLSPGEIERVNDLEAEIGKPMYRPKRFNAMGIHGVIQWAQNGRDRGSFDDEEAECSSLFGCGI
jgi:3'-phosphoadenosine 5'-phosphosulfate sulfotransferase (PAPS reductase)/FAD synthetase